VTRQPDFSTVTREGRAPAWDTLAVLLAGLALAVAVGGAWRARAEARTAGERLAGVRREADAAAGRLAALSARARSEARGLLPAAEALPAQIVADLASALPGDARLERLSIDYARGGALEMHVVARDAATWDRLIAQLERSPDFREVAPGPETRDAEVRSVIRARWAGRSR
jgi:hypothetical protein